MYVIVVMVGFQCILPLVTYLPKNKRTILHVYILYIQILWENSLHSGWSVVLILRQTIVKAKLFLIKSSLQDGRSDSTQSENRANPCCVVYVPNNRLTTCPGYLLHLIGINAEMVKHHLHVGLMLNYMQNNLFFLLEYFIAVHQVSELNSSVDWNILFHLWMIELCLSWTLRAERHQMGWDLILSTWMKLLFSAVQELNCVSSSFNLALIIGCQTHLSDIRYAWWWKAKFLYTFQKSHSEKRD